MSTRSMISVKTADDHPRYSGVYCHFDGYIHDEFGVGHALAHHWNCDEAARELLASGGMSALKGSTVHRPYGDDPVTGSIDQLYLLARSQGCEYFYVWTGRLWRWCGVVAQDWRFPKSYCAPEFMRRLDVMFGDLPAGQNLRALRALRALAGNE